MTEAKGSGAVALLMWLIVLAALLAGVCPAVAAVPDYVARAIADPGRPPEQSAADGARKPAELLTFAGVRPGERVADFMSGSGYFTRLFSRVVGPTGRVYAFLPEEELKNCAPAETDGTRAIGRDARYDNVRVLTGPVDHFRAPETLDLVWTSLNFHDLYDSFMGPANVLQVTRSIFNALKPGGVLLVVDHVAQAGSGVRDTETLHRIDPEVIIRDVEAAGFRLEAQSALLRNRGDDHRLRVFDAAIRGRTDQVVLKFRRPALELIADRYAAQTARLGSADGRQH
jgi:predicted methyltransferase